MSTSFTNFAGFTPGDLPVPPKRMAKAEFLAWAMATELQAEWVDGEVILMAPANRDHMETRRWFDNLLTMYVRRRQLGRVGDDMFVDLDQQRRLRVPDMFFVAKARESIIQQTVLVGPPDLVLEVVSPDSQTRDRRQKYLEYEAFGVREYWIIDPIVEQIEVYALNAEGKYEAVAIESRVVEGFWIRTAWLWRDSRPDEDAAFAEMTGQG